MTTYNVRCKNSDCRHRRVINRHPDSYRRVPRCSSCGSDLGWRIEYRHDAKRNRCHCNGYHFTHAAGSPMCEQHPRHEYNRMKREGVSDEDMPLELMGEPCDEDCPF